jgi:uncharacterized phage protein (TIGR02218 family)
MSYQGEESSISGGAPRELYRFVHGSTRWLLTNLPTSYTYQGETYEPAAVRRGAPEIGQDIARSGIEVRLPRDHALASLFVSTPADASVSLTIYRMHITDSASEVIVYWRGRVAGARLTGSELALRCEPLLASMRRVGPRARYSLTCRHALYSAGCGASASTFRVAGTVQTVSGSVVTINEAGTKPNGYFVAGMLEAGSVRRMIVAHSGTTLTLAAPVVGLVAGASVMMYAGCDHLLATCRDRFANVANFGGFPWIPRKNPFAGDAIV